jgi:hypothetical protein
MYVIDARHHIERNGFIAVKRGPARKMANFVAAVVAHTSDFDRPEVAPGPVCFKCRKRDGRRVRTSLVDDQTIFWHCPACRTDRRISGWQGSFWDLRHGMPSD